MKRVNCLYRVSTLGQVDVTKDDIPMQKIACHEFAERQGWVITEEYTEKGVSGSKVHADKRDAIQQLKQNAINKEFDILLVFMFDRIGRIDDETPFVVEWFVEQGIEVWSVQEGEQRFDTHVDKLMNYIRFWQAAGESAKTSERIRTRMRQLVEEGIFAKGIAPFGYKLVKRGRLNKKGNEVRDLVIDEDEVAYVRRIFEMTVFQNMGTHVIAKKLNEEGVRTHGGKELTVSFVKRILKNKTYCGYIESGGVSSPKLDDLSIISEELWNRAQDVVHQRERNYEERRTISIRTQGDKLLSGNIFCAHCGRRLVYTSFNKDYVRKNGEISPYHIRRYQCSSRTWHRCECSGSASYNADKVEEAVIAVIKDVFSRITDVPETTAVETKMKTQLSEARAVQKRQSALLDKLNRQQEKLQLEIANSLTGDSIYTADDLAIALRTLKSKMIEAEQKLEEANEVVEKGKQAAEAVIPMYNRFVSWANTFDEMSVEEKRAVISELISRIEVSRGYELNITLNIDYEQFCDSWNAVAV